MGTAGTAARRVAEEASIAIEFKASAISDDHKQMEGRHGKQPWGNRKGVIGVVVMEDE